MQPSIQQTLPFATQLPRTSPRSPKPPAHAAGSATSAAAAASIAELAPGMRGEVYGHIVASGGATREEISHALEMRISTVSARVTELKHLGLVIERGTRPTTSGRRAAVVIAKHKEVHR